MTTIYAVSSGSYSDYSIVALFSTRELAQTFMDRHDRGHDAWNEIEEFALDEGVEHMRQGMARYSVRMGENGDSYNVGLEAYWFTEKPDTEFHKPAGRIKQRWFNWYGWAMSEEHALKIANEHRIRLLAA
jgi:hypothetical protein